MDLANHGVARDVAKLGRDLTGRQAGLPQLLQLLDTLIGPGDHRHCNLSLAGPRGLSLPSAATQLFDPPAESSLCRRNPHKGGRTPTRYQTIRRSRAAARDVVSDVRDATIWRDSRARVRNR